MSRSARIVISANSAWNLFNFRSGIIRALLADGHEVVAIAPFDESSQKLIAMGCQFVPIVIDNKGTNPLRDGRLVFNYRRHLEKLKADCFLAYTIKPNIYGSLAAQSLGIPVINNVSGLGTAFLSSGSLQRVAILLYRVAFRRSQRVFFQNDADRQLFVCRGIVEEARTGLLPGSGIDLRQFSETEFVQRGPGEPVSVLMICRVLYDKGICEYVAAARQLKAEGFLARFCILGFMDVENRTAVSRETMESWVREGAVVYLGHTNDVRPYISDADCVVLPSYREGTPRTLLEAAAMGRPLVATDVPGCREVVDNGLNGLLCRAKDADDLARAMREMLTMSLEDRRKMGAESRRKIECQFDEQLVVDRYRVEIAAACFSQSVI